MKRISFFLFLMSINSLHAMQLQTPEQLKDAYENSLKDYLVHWPDKNTLLQILRHPKGDQTLKKIGKQDWLWANGRGALAYLLYDLIQFKEHEKEAARAMNLLIKIAKKKNNGDIVNDRIYSRNDGDEGITLLREAVEQVNIPCAKILLEHNADANKHDLNHRDDDIILYPLWSAYRKTQSKEGQEMFELLKSYGAKFYPEDQKRILKDEARSLKYQIRLLSK